MAVKPQFTTAETGTGPTVPRRPSWPLFAAALLLLGGTAAVAVVFWPESDPETLAKESRAAFEARRFDELETKLNRLARLRSPTPFDTMLRAQLAMAKAEKARQARQNEQADRWTEQAIADLRRVPDSEPISSQARLQEGQLELRRRRGRAAEEAFLQAIKLDPRQVQARRELVYLYGMQLRRKELGEQFQALSELTPLSFQHVFTWCLTRGCIWEPAEVMAELGQYIQADPTDRSSRLALAESQRQVGQLEEAEQTLKPLPDSDPDARAARARMALDRSDQKAAERLLADGPADHPGLARLRGRLAYDRHDVQSAIRHFRLAYAVNPDDRDTLFFLGNALRLSGDIQGSKRFLEAARDQDRLNTLIQRAASTKDREDPKLPYLLGEACEALHRLPEARCWYKLAIARDPLDPRAQQALYRVQHTTASKNQPGG